MTPYYTDDAVTLYAGDCLDVLRELPDASVDAVVTDPPYLLGFMAREWDTKAAHEHLEWHGAWAAQALRVLKPGGHMLAFGGSRTWHRLACAVEDAGFEIRDSIAWLYGSGFPKSLDVSKAIDRAAGAEREIVGSKLGFPGYSLTNGNGDHRTYSRGLGNTGSGAAECAVTAPATDAARQWQGWGTALKPAFEPIVVARKPLTGTVAQNVTTHGAGALNIAACRVGAAEDKRAAGTKAYQRFDPGSESKGTQPAPHDGLGRWPANVVLDETAAAELDQQVPNASYNRRGDFGLTDRNGQIYGGGAGLQVSGTVFGYGDSGGASRFFPVFRYEPKAPTSERPRLEDGTAHATVKPLDLMRWLVRLVTPPGGVVLDCFLGSGTTAEACVVEGFRCIGVERDPDYLRLAVTRLSKPIAPVLFGEDTA